jgi:hypothetical protein
LKYIKLTSLTIGSLTDGLLVYALALYQCRHFNVNP